MFDEICRRSINFVRACLSHESSLIREIAAYGINFARSESPLGLNAMFCAERYHSALNSILHASFSDIINLQFRCTVDETQLQAVGFLSELIEIRDNLNMFPQFILSRSELNDIIAFICTCKLI